MQRIFFAAFTAIIVVFGMSAGAQAKIHIYRHQGADPYQGTQTEACRLFGFDACPPFFRGRPIEQVCKPYWIADGSQLWAMTFGKDQVDGPWIVELGAPRLAYVCTMKNGWAIGMYNRNPDVHWGCGNYFYARISELHMTPFQQPIAQETPPPYYPPPQPAMYSPMLPTTYYNYQTYPYYNGSVEGPGGTSIWVHQGGPQAYAYGGRSESFSNAVVGPGVAPVMSRHGFHHGFHGGHHHWHHR